MNGYKGPVADVWPSRSSDNRGAATTSRLRVTKGRRSYWRQIGQQRTLRGSPWARPGDPEGRLGDTAEQQPCPLLPFLLRSDGTEPRALAGNQAEWGRVRGVKGQRSKDRKYGKNVSEFFLSWTTWPAINKNTLISELQSEKQKVCGWERERKQEWPRGSP